MKVYNRMTGMAFEIENSKSDAMAARIAKMRRAVWAGVCRASEWSAEGAYRLIMVTLTYAMASDWHGRQVRQLTEWSKRKGCVGHVWVAELQERGALHYHVLILWPGTEPWIKPVAGGGWEHGFTWVTDGVKYPWYIMKYMQKGLNDGNGNQYPRGARLYGISQSIVRSMRYEQRLVYRENQVPAWYREGAEDCDTVLSGYRVRGGVDRQGTLAISPYSARDLAPIDAIADNMRRVWGDLSHPFQS